MSDSLPDWTAGWTRYLWIKSLNKVRMNWSRHSRWSRIRSGNSLLISTTSFSVTNVWNTSRRSRRTQTNIDDSHWLDLPCIMIAKLESSSSLEVRWYSGDADGSTSRAWKKDWCERKIVYTFYIREWRVSRWLFAGIWWKERTGLICWGDILLGWSSWRRISRFFSLDLSFRLFVCISYANRWMGSSGFIRWENIGICCRYLFYWMSGLTMFITIDFTRSLFIRRIGDGIFVLNIIIIFCEWWGTGLIGLIKVLCEQTKTFFLNWKIWLLE